MWQGWSWGLVYCPGGNATDPIWRVLASSDGISSWTHLKPQHSNPNPKPLANQLRCSDFLTLLTPLIIPHRIHPFLESLIPLKNWCSIHARWPKSSLKHSIRFHMAFFPSLKQNFIAYRSYIYIYIYIYHTSLVGWGCRIHRLHLCRGVRLTQWVFWIWHKAI